MSSENYPETAQKEIRRVLRLPLVSHILDELRARLSDGLKYHSVQHTESVLSEAVYFAVSDGLPERQIDLLGIAAAYHDAGFLTRPNDNEEIAAEMVRTAMEKSNDFSSEEIELVAHMILDTTLTDNGAEYENRPSSELSKYLLDADLSNLGRDDFFEKVGQLDEELGGDPATRLRNTCELLKNHRWLTPAAQRLREKRKLENLAHVERLIAEHQSEHAG